MFNQIQNAGADKPIVLVAYLCPSSETKISDLIKSARTMEAGEVRKDAGETDPSKRYVYGLKGICDLFGVAHSTAQKYKDGILKDACYQSGRKIVVDVEKALVLFNQSGRAAL